MIRIYCHGIWLRVATKKRNQRTFFKFTVCLLTIVGSTWITIELVYVRKDDYRHLEWRIIKCLGVYTPSKFIEIFPRSHHLWKSLTNFYKNLIEKSNGFMFILHRWCKLSSTSPSHSEFLDFIVITSPHSISKVSPRCFSHDKCLLEASLLSRFVRVKEFLIEESFWNLHWRVLPRYKESFYSRFVVVYELGNIFKRYLLFRIE